MLVRKIVVLYAAELVHGGKVKVAALGAVKDCLALHSCKELTLLVKELECVPLTGIMAGGYDDSTVSAGKCYRKFGGGGAGKAAAHHIDSTGDERADYQLFYHLAADACITAHNNLVTIPERSFALFEAFAVSISEFDNIDRSQIVARSPSYGAADTGN